LAHDDRGAGPAIVLVHGHPFNRRMWGPQLASLSDRFRVIAPDLPGYGASPSYGSHVTMRELAAAVLELLDTLAVDHATVVGLSMGGLVAMELALAHPERVDGLVLAATTAAPTDPEETRTRRAVAADIEEHGMLTTTLDMASRLFGPTARSNPTLVLEVLTMMLTTRPAGAAAALRGRAERPDYTTLLPELRVPALVIAGDQDPYAPEPVVRQLVAALPDPDVVRLRGAGHLPNLEAPERFDAALRAFVARSPGTR
jgi:pimeloyl-ACP methyl ester carboxylesterase